jgi:hypothetical protein
MMPVGKRLRYYEIFSDVHHSDHFNLNDLRHLPARPVQAGVPFLIPFANAGS